MKILFQGDSITDADRDYNGGRFAMGKGYAQIICTEMSYKFPYKYEFVNRGVNGSRIVDIYARIKKDCWNERPDVLSIMVGVNDVWHEFQENNGVETDRYKKMYYMLLEDTVRVLPDTKIIILEPFVLHGEGTREYYDKMRKEVRAKAEISAKTAENFNAGFVPLQDKFDEAAKRTNDTAYWTFDGVHPTSAGHRLIAEEWLRVFEKKAYGADCGGEIKK